MYCQRVIIIAFQCFSVLLRMYVPANIASGCYVCLMHLSLCVLIVHWDHEAKADDDISVKKGDTVTYVDHHRGNAEDKFKVSQ